MVQKLFVDAGCEIGVIRIRTQVLERQYGDRIGQEFPSRLDRLNDCILLGVRDEPKIECPR